MSQHDFDIANQGFAAFRADLNNALKALGSVSSGTAEPATTYANQLWYETDTNILHIRNEANSAWLDLMVIDQTTGSPSFTAGNVGIGTSSPGAMLDLTSGNAGLGILAATNRLRFTDTDPTLIADQTTGSVEWYTSDTDSPGVHAYIGTLGSNTGAAALTFGTGVGGSSAERMRIDASGNVGIGTSSPGAMLELAGGNAGLGILAATNRLRFSDSDPTLISGQSTGAIEWYTSDTDAPGVHAYIGTLGSNTGAAVLTFGTGVGGSTSERARIGSDGVVTVGQTSNIDVFSGSADGCSIEGAGAISLSRSANASLFIRRRTSNGAVAAFLRDTTQVGRIDVTTTATAYVTSSDYRLKENVQPMQDALAKIAQLNPVTYTWKVDGSDGQGFIAHELQAVVPDCVSGEKDAVDAEGNPQYQGVDTSFLVATLVKAVQELTARIAALEAN